MHEQPTPEHEWLHKLVGEWTSEIECSMGPDQPPMQQKGREVVRSLGGLWTIGQGTMDGSEVGESIMTLGYDPRQGQFIGTFVALMMTHLWPYRGSLDESRRVLTLDSEGPQFHRRRDDGQVSGHYRVPDRRPSHAEIPLSAPQRRMVSLHDRPLPTNVVDFARSPHSSRAKANR
jgi:hypothetical protein